MAEGSPRLGGFSSGLAVILNGNSDSKEVGSSKRHIVSHCEDFSHQSLERTLEYIFGLPNKSIASISGEINSGLIGAIIKNQCFRACLTPFSWLENRDGISDVGLEELSVCGDIRIIRSPLLLESLAIFSSVRTNSSVWKGKWMYEVTLETSGVQQIGWATMSCPFTDDNGVGDVDDSYAYDGKRVRKWNKEANLYGQSWVVGDVIGCCIDLDQNEISFYRNGFPLGVAFCGIRKMEQGFGYCPAISLSQGERCDLNIGSRPFKFPVTGYLPLKAPPSVNSSASNLLRCLSRLLDMQSELSSFEKLRKLKRFVSFEDVFLPVARGICKEFFSLLETNANSVEYVAWGSFISFMMEVLRVQIPHNYSNLDRILDVLLEFQGSMLVFEHLINALSYGCRTAELFLKECPCSGSYPYLALACYLLRREKLMMLWWNSADFELLFEGFLSQKAPNKQDLESMMPSVWWPGSHEDVSCESNMLLTTAALSEAVSKIEEKHRDLCKLVIQFILPPHLPGSVFMAFLQNLLLKNRGADQNIPLLGVSSNSVLVSLYTVLLHFLSEGFGSEDICDWLKLRENPYVGFLHRGGKRSYPISLLLKSGSHRTEIARLGGSFNHLSKLHPVIDREEEMVRWDEGCMDDEEIRVTHSSILKPSCCSNYDFDFARSSKDPVRLTRKSSKIHCSRISERSVHHVAECSDGSLDDEISDKPSTSDQFESEYSYHPMQHTRFVPRETNLSSATLREEELLDVLLLLYHIGLVPNFKQVSYYMSHQLQSISLLEEADKQIRERACNEQLKRLKEARNCYREEVIHCVRQCAWYRISLFSRWKQRGMYATCMWTVQLLLVLSKMDSVFIYTPEFYIESLVDCFHVLRKGDPPFVPSSIFIKKGLASFVTFVVTHFNDPRISSAELRDLLLQSITVLVQYKEYLAAFECNRAATQRMPKALLSAFDNRSWIPITNILLQLCKGSGFGSSKHGESSLSSFVFQRLLREACINNEELFSAFLNRLFNTLSWTMTEFSVSVREMKEKYQVLEFHQKKCNYVFDLSCNLTRVLEFCTREIPQAFLKGTDTNLRRLTELIVFILNHISSAADADTEIFNLSLRRQSQSLERGMILAPLVGIISNLMDASEDNESVEQNDVVGIFAGMHRLHRVNCGFQFLLDYNWGGSFGGDSYLAKLEQLKNFSARLVCRSSELPGFEEELEPSDGICCICYASEADARFLPCYHVSCSGCITRHLLNCHRCFFCNASVLEVRRIGENTG